jgi:hypothetical protein
MGFIGFYIATKNNNSSVLWKAIPPMLNMCPYNNTFHIQG